MSRCLRWTLLCECVITYIFDKLKEKLDEFFRTNVLEVALWNKKKKKTRKDRQSETRFINPCPAEPGSGSAQFAIQLMNLCKYLDQGIWLVDI